MDDAINMIKLFSSINGVDYREIIMNVLVQEISSEEIMNIYPNIRLI